MSINPVRLEFRLGYEYLRAPSKIIDGRWENSTLNGLVGKTKTLYTKYGTKATQRSEEIIKKYYTKSGHHQTIAGEFIRLGAPLRPPLDVRDIIKG